MKTILNYQDLLKQNNMFCILTARVNFQKNIAFKFTSKVLKRMKEEKQPNIYFEK